MCARPKVVQFVSFWHEWDWTGKIKLKFQHNCIWHENNENFIQKKYKKKIINIYQVSRLNRYMNEENIYMRSC